MPVVLVPVPGTSTGTNVLPVPLPPPGPGTVIVRSYLRDTAGEWAPSTYKSKIRLACTDVLQLQQDLLPACGSPRSRCVMHHPMIPPTCRRRAPARHSAASGTIQNHQVVVSMVFKIGILISRIPKRRHYIIIFETFFSLSRRIINQLSVAVKWCAHDPVSICVVVSLGMRYFSLQILWFDLLHYFIFVIF